jgi:hypothetical protein
MLLLFDHAMHIFSQVHASIQAKLSRLIEASAFLVSNGVQNLFRKITGSAAGDDYDDTNGKQ